MRIKRGRRALRLGLIAVVLLFGCQWSAHADDTFQPYPGLPAPGFVQGGWIRSSQVGMSETAKARQWVRIPGLTAAVWSGTEATVIAPAPGVARRQTVKGEATFVSPPGHTQTYGYLEPLTVRTAGFGLIPVEATVQVSQRRADGLPIPISAVLQQDELDNGDWVFHPARVRDAFNVRVLKVVVDGVDIGLTGNCRTARPAPVEMVGKGFTIPAAIQSSGRAGPWLWETKDPSEFFHPTYGGQMEGTVDIPAFTGCTTRTGDNLSAMITASVAGPDNHVVFRAQLFCFKIVDGTYYPPAPGENTPARSGCAAPDALPYPNRR